MGCTWQLRKMRNLNPSHQSTTVRPPGKNQGSYVNNKCWLGDPTAVMKSTNSSLRDDDDDEVVVVVMVMMMMMWWWW